MGSRLSAKGVSITANYRKMGFRMKKKLFVNRIAKAVLDGTTSLFLGAGGSVDAGYPSWKYLYEPLADELGLNINEISDLYKLAQYYSNTYGDSVLRKHINDYINRAFYESDLLSELLDLGFPNLWTTNFDNALELNLNERKILTNKVFRDRDLTNVDLSKRVNIFKLNGDIASIESLIATQSDYEKYQADHEMMLTFLKRDLITNTFLFIGYSFSDHLVLNCLNNIQECLGDNIPEHYTIMKSNPDSAIFEYSINDLQKRYPLNVLLVDDYKEMLEILSEINNQVRSSRVFISGSLGYDVSQKIENEIYEFLKAVAQTLFDKDLRIVNGVGRHFGVYLIGYADQYLLKKGVKDIDRHIIVRPFIEDSRDPFVSKSGTRREIIKDCGTAIFLGGQSSNSTHVSGVYDEFIIADNLGLVIIPIRCPDMASEQIWKHAKDNLTKYPYLEKSIDALTIETEPESLSKIILEIIREASRDSAF